MSLAPAQRRPDVQTRDDRCAPRVFGGQGSFDANEAFLVGGQAVLEN